MGLFDFLKKNKSSNISPSNREFVSTVLKRYDDIRMQLMIAGINEGNQKAFQIVSFLHHFACPLFYAWEYWGYGHMSDFWKEDLCLEVYRKFKLKNVLEEARNTYRGISFSFPFNDLDHDGSLKKDTLEILGKLIQDLENH